MTADETPSLDSLAREFADRLTTLTRGVLGPDSPPFRALNTGRQLQLSPIHDDVSCRIPVHINRSPVLSLRVRYFCCWDGSSSFLAIDQSDIHLHYHKITEPLLRFEYVRDSSGAPGAHIQVHAHRDEVAFLQRLAESGRPKTAFNQRKVPRLAELHLPVGGHRMRPALEDVLMFLHREFRIDTQSGWQHVIAQHLQEWRDLQLRAATRDAPDVAAEVLTGLGYHVTPPAVPAPRRPRDEVRLYMP